MIARVQRLFVWCSRSPFPAHAVSHVWQYPDQFSELSGTPPHAGARLPARRPGAEHEGVHRQAGSGPRGAGPRLRRWVSLPALHGERRAQVRFSSRPTWSISPCKCASQCLFFASFLNYFRTFRINGLGFLQQIKPSAKGSCNKYISSPRFEIVYL